MFNYIFVLSSLWLIYLRLKFVIDINLIILIAFTALYNIMLESGGPVGRITEVLYPAAFYIYGKFILSKLEIQTELVLLLLIFIIFFNLVHFVHYIINVLDYGLVFSNLEYNIDAKQNLAFTLFCSYFALNIGLFPILFTTPYNLGEKTNKRIAIILSVVSIIIIGTIGQRTGFYILTICTTIYLLIFTQKKIKNIAFYLFIFSAVMLVYYLNKTLITDSVIYNKLFIVDANRGFLRSRTDIWEAAFNIFKNSPKGGKNQLLMNGYFYAHNLWLDVGLTAGYYVLAPLVVLTILYLRNLFLLFKKSFLTSTSKIYYTLISIAIFSTFMVEPIMQGYTLFFCSFAFVFGTLSGFIKRIKNNIIFLS
jgi:hypothetical protein